MGRKNNHRLDWRGGKLFLGAAPLGVDDELEAARILLKLNLASKDDTFTTYRGKTPCLTARVGWAADRVVRSTPGGTPVFRLARAVPSPADGQIDPEATNDP